MSSLSSLFPGEGSGGSCCRGKTCCHDRTITANHTFVSDSSTDEPRSPSRELHRGPAFPCANIVPGLQQLKQPTSAGVPTEPAAWHSPIPCLRLQSVLSLGSPVWNLGQGPRALERTDMSHDSPESIIFLCSLASSFSRLHTQIHSFTDGASVSRSPTIDIQRRNLWWPPKSWGRRSLLVYT